MTNKIYIEYSFSVEPLQPACDILLAELGELPFESFVEEHDGLLAYILQDDWHPHILESVQILNAPETVITYSLRELQPENWNATWEQHFTPIFVGNSCVVRAPFHDPPDVEYDIVIVPKMSFGTGHHETTQLMLGYLLKYDFEGKAVLDMGCGTGVLAIMAAMKNADPVHAIDNDPWCYLNALENVERNGQGHIRVFEGDAGLLKGQQYDCILANINRNCLLTDIPVYIRHLTAKGWLILSGFYADDIPVISGKCLEHQLYLFEKKSMNHWAAVVYHQR